MYTIHYDGKWYSVRDPEGRLLYTTRVRQRAYQVARMHNHEVRLVAELTK
jgi:hypothetical protein